MITIDRYGNPLNVGDKVQNIHQGYFRRMEFIPAPVATITKISAGCNAVVHVRYDGSQINSVWAARLDTRKVDSANI
jgi:hypothetical protein